MVTRNFQGKTLPLLGFGCMRLPLLPGGKAGDIDEKSVEEMVKVAMEAGVNYFDTAYPYHAGESENVMGRVLSKYPRESFYLADKYPGHQIVDEYRPAEVFEDQLKKCGVEYFDFYLLHNVFENSIHTYNDPRWGIMEYFIEQKKKGRIRHLGFSTHGGLPIMKEFLDKWGEHMEFCQIQLNYLDWTLQNAAAKVQLLREHNIPIWVMEPIRGGRIATLSPQNTALLSPFRKDVTPVEWSFRFLQDIEGVAMILSGMSNMEQLKQNIDVFKEEKPLNEEEKKALFQVAENLKNSVPCTGCGYCLKDCPKGLDIPNLLSIYNDLQVAKSYNASMRLEFLPEEKKPSACIGCGLCSKNCPQKIDIPKALKKLCGILSEIPSWAEISKERAIIAEKARNEKK
ncbi:MAG: aldo/keto reductase [Clostridia bacterium]|nr:aldo/keto reductase [Clostridia bacterium]